jgi:hypothetical protein
VCRSWNERRKHRSGTSQRVSVSNLRRRIRNLEAQLTEESGLVPNTPQWRAHCSDWFKRRMRGENPPGRIPLEAVLSSCKPTRGPMKAISRRVHTCDNVTIIGSKARFCQ